MEFNTDPNMGTDEFHVQKIVYLIFMSILIFIFAFYTINVEGAMTEAWTYWTLIISCFVIFLISKVIANQKGLDFPNPITWEKKTLFGEIALKWQLILLGTFALIALFIFFRIGESTALQIVSAPQFQLVENTPQLKGILSGLAGFVEDFAFASIMPCLIFGLVFALSRNFPLAFMAALLIAPFIFMEFHVARYGHEMIVTMQSVYMFGLISTLIALVFRNMLLVSLIHFANNFGITLWSNIQIANPMLYFWIIFFIISGLCVFVYTRAKSKSSTSLGVR